MQHHSARPIALWLQSINYVFVPCKDSDFQSLEMGLEKSVKFDNEDIYGIPGLTDIYDESDKGYFDAVVILDFKKANHPDIQLITSRGHRLKWCLIFIPVSTCFGKNTFAHSRPACVMNIITHDKAYSIYPWATFIERRSLVYNRSENSFKGRSKYESRGWIQLPYLEAYDYNNPFSSFARGSRRLGDHKCWTINLLPTIDSHKNYMDSNTWFLHYIKLSTKVGLNWKVFATHQWELLKEIKLFDNTYLMDTVRRDRIWCIIKLLQKNEIYSKR